MKQNTFYNILALLLLAIFFSSCSPNPRRALTSQERQADMAWLTSKVEANYAPLNYKEELHGFDYEELKKEYFELAGQEQSNEAFYMLMKKFVAEFKDGHMNASLNRSTLPGRSKVAFLGFTGHRHGDNFLVKEFAPTFNKEGDYPVKKDDEILEYNGMKLKDAVDAELTPYRNVGNQEANYTILMPSLFLRSSLSAPMPEKENVLLKIKRGSKEFDVEVPWVSEDYAKYAKAQKEAAAKKAKAGGLDFAKEEAKAASLLQIAGAHPYVTDSFVKNFILNPEIKLGMEQFLQKLSNLAPGNTFEFKQTQGPISDLEIFNTVMNGIKAQEEKDQKPKAPLEDLKKERYVPSKVYPVAEAKTFPAYVAIMSKDKKRNSVGYVRIDTFSPAGAEKDVLKEFKNTLKFFRDFGVDKVVIDLIDNGGGSLSLGLKLAALLSAQKISMPSMKYMLNDAWMDQYETNSRTNVNDAARAISERAYMDMLESFNRGEKLSENMEVSSLYPFGIVPNDELTLFKKPYNFQLAVVTNEMCASMCDIFSSILKENNMATFVGEQTMGAGGNVVNHYSAPNSGLNVSLTESLVVSSSGEYLENNGVKPDVKMEVNKFKNEKYKTVLNKGFEVLTKED